ncbi:MAG TPA: ABC transporter permease [Edaphocola sp.]|nr:ABC transporter permease [Edaphocola sp.]
MKTAIIIQREYLSRVKKRSFIITTLLLPLLFIVFMVGTSYLATKSTREKNVVVVDQSGLVKDKLKSTNSVKYSYSDLSVEQLKEQLYADSFTALVYMPKFDLDKPQTFEIFSNENLGTEVASNLRNQVNELVRAERIRLAGIDEDKYKSASADMVSFQYIVGKEEKKGNTDLATVIGMASGFLLYIFMLLYGASVMTSVMEEKTNRIAEIIVSSVKPFQLMMGKIVGVALVGLTQVALWVLFLVIVGMVAMPFISGMQVDPEQAKALSEQAMAGGNNEAMQLVTTFMQTGTLEGVNLITTFCWFIFYFLGGYFLYAALFAAVGSLVNEGQQDAQQFSTIITLPIIFSIIIMSTAIKDPNSGLAVFGSIFPLTSPIVMMARIPFGVPTFQLLMSVLCLAGGFVLTTLLAAKIYRTGILMYGKKITMKEVGKWIIRKN